PGVAVRVIDVNVDPFRQLNAGDSYILDVSNVRLRSQLANGRFAASADFEELALADAIFVSVPTPFGRAKEPDLRFVVAAAEQIAKHLRPQQLVILESTTFPGTTEEVLRPILERSGLRAGRDFYLAFSPER